MSLILGSTIYRFFALIGINIEKIAAIMLMVAMALFPEHDYNLDKSSFNDEHLKMIEEDTGLQLPTGSIGLDLYYKKDRRLEPMYWAKIEIPEAKKDELLGQITPIENGNKEIFLETYKNCLEPLAWWQPTRQTLIAQRYYRKVIVWFSKDDKRWLLYVWFNAR